MRKIISLSGKAKSGKDTVAEYLVEKHGFKQESWAGNLKRMCQKIFNLTDHEVFTQEGKEKPLKFGRYLEEEQYYQILGWMKATIDVDLEAIPFDELMAEKFKPSELPLELETPRQILQVVGTEICRSIYQKYHVDLLKLKIKNDENTDFVISDSRFQNEVEAFRDYENSQTITIKIERDMEAIKESAHASESTLDTLEGFDYVIENNGTLEELYAKIEEIVKD